MKRVIFVLALVGSAWAQDNPKKQKGGKDPGADPKFAAAQKALTEPGHYEKDGKKYERGLYPGGSNEIPKAHLEAGLKLASTISSGDKIVVAALGHSNPRAYFKAFDIELRSKTQSGEVNPKIQFASGCKSGKICPDWEKEAAGGKISVDPKAQALFVLTTYHRASGRADGGDDALPFEEKMQKMKKQMKAILHGAVKTCPDLKVAFIGCDAWRAKCEPKVYEEGFAIKWLIEDQIKGDPELAYEGSGRKAPWLCWGGYIWEPAAPRDRYVDDEVHPTEAGEKFVCSRWFDALHANPAAHGWFIAKPAGKK